MKKKILIILLASSLLEARQVVDKIVARVNGINVLKSDLKRPRINDKPFSLNKVIEQELYFQEASKFKMVPSMLEVEKQIAGYRSNSGFKDSSDDEFEKHLKESLGFSVNALKNEYTRYIATANLLDHKIKTGVFVTAQEVEDYYKTHPNWVEEKYKLKTAIIPFETAKTVEEAQLVRKIDWIEHDDWISKSNIADNMSHLFSLEKNQTSRPIKTQFGFQLVYLLDKQLKQKKSLKDSYVSIEKQLREAKMAKFEDKFKKELKIKAHIVYL